MSARPSTSRFSNKRFLNKKKAAKTLKVGEAESAPRDKAQLLSGESSKIITQLYWEVSNTKDILLVITHKRLILCHILNSVQSNTVKYSLLAKCIKPRITYHQYVRIYYSMFGFLMVFNPNQPN